MQSLPRILLALALLTAASGATAQVVVNVDDTGTSTGYTNGVGGQFSGPGAIKAAVDAINADPTTGVDFRVDITDTDGVADTYVGDLQLDRENLTVQQVPNGSGTDVAITIQSDQTAGGALGMVSLLRADTALIGLSTAKRIVIDVNVNPAQPAWGTYTNANASPATFENLEYANGTGGARLAHFGNSTGQQFTGCLFNVGAPGPQLGTNAAATFDDCEFRGTAFPIVLAGANTAAQVNNSLIAARTNFHMNGANASLTLTDCTFDFVANSWNTNGLLRDAQLADGTVFRLIRPTFLNDYPHANPIFDTANDDVDIIVEGASAAGKADLRPFRTGTAGLFSRQRNGSLTFTNCIVDDRNDCAGDTTAAPQRVTYNFTNCVMESGADFGAVNVGGKFTRDFNVVNTVWDGTGRNNIFLTNASPGAQPSVVNLTHVTLYGQPVQRWIIGDAPLTVNANYTIFDSNSGTELQNAGTLNGTLNVIDPSVTINAAVTNNLSGTISGDPLLDASGKLQSGSAAVDAAVGSTEAFDFEGDARPQGNEVDVGADESPFTGPTKPIWLTGPFVESRVAGTGFSQSFARGTDYEDVDGDPLTFTLGAHTGPGTGAWLTEAGGTVSGTAQDYGSHQWILEVEDDDLNVATTTLTINVTSDTVRVIVDDLPGNDVPYTNGVGGNFTGAGSVRDAALAINGDPSVVNAWQIWIIDTDGTTDTYTGDAPLNKPNLELKQVANGAGNDTPVIIESSGQNAQGIIEVTQDNVVIEGLSPAKRIDLRVRGGGAPQFGTLLNGDTTIRNLRYTGGGAGFCSNGNSAVQTWEDCTFETGVGTNGPQITVGSVGTWTRCDWDLAGNFPLVVVGSSTATTQDCSFVGSARLHLGGTLAYTSIRDTWNIGTPIMQTQVSSDATYEFVDPNFVGLHGVIPFQLEDKVARFTLRGTDPANKADVRGFASESLVRCKAATVTLENIITDTGVNTNVANTAVVFVDMIMNNVESYGGRYGAVGVAGGPRRYFLTNCIFDGDNALNGAVIHANTGTGSRVEMTHCTIYGAPNPPDELIRMGSSNNDIVLNYCIVDGSDVPFISANGNAVSGTHNVIVPGSSGGFGGGDSLVTTIVADPQLDAMGRLTADSPAIDNAIGSVLGTDVDGESRPQGTGSDIGADESPFSGGGPVWLVSPIDEGDVVVGDPVSRALVRGVDFEDFDGDPITLDLLSASHVGPGDGLWLSLAGNTLSGTAADVGTHQWLIEAEDDDTNTAVTTFTLRVVGNTVGVVVDDLPGNDAAYVNGVGGNFSGPTALQDAVTAVNNDPTAQISFWNIDIVDTDGTSDTYTGDFRLTQDGTTIQQVPNGGGNDMPVNIVSDNTRPDGIMSIGASDCTIAGLSPEKKLILHTNGTGATPPWGTHVNGAGVTNATFRNITYVGGGSGTPLAHNGTIDDLQTWVDCDFLTTGNGPQVGTGDAQFTRCLFKSTGFPVVVLAGADATISSSTFEAAIQLHLAGANSITINDSAFDFSGGAASIVSSTQLLPGCVITINRPTITTATAAVSFNIEDTTCTLIINGAGPDDKADLRPLRNGQGDNLFGRARNGRFVFTDCIIDDRFDCAGAPAAAGQLVQFELDRCIVERADFGAVNEAGIQRQFTVTNTIWDATDRNVAFTTQNGVPGTTLTLTHSTIYGQPVAQLIGMDGSDNAVIANYNILSNPGGNITTAGGGGTWTGAYNLIDGTFTPGVDNLTDTVSGAASLAGDGRSLGTGAEIDAAIGSITPIDIDGDSRPNGPESDLGADEFFRVNAAGDWSLYR